MNIPTPRAEMPAHSQHQSTSSCADFGERAKRPSDDLSPYDSTRQVGVLAPEGKRIPAMATMEMLDQLPKMDDDDDIGEEREHIVPRDDERDLKFRGVLLASAAPSDHKNGRWTELRAYRTSGENYVYARVGRSINEGERDKFEASVYDPTDTFVSRVPSNDSWSASAQKFFGYSTLAKELYRDLQLDTNELID